MGDKTYQQTAESERRENTGNHPVFSFTECYSLTYTTSTYIHYYNTVRKMWTENVTKVDDKRLSGHSAKDL